MAHLDLIRTVHTPLTADGRSIKNAFGVVIATVSDDIMAQAIATMVNLGMPHAQEISDTYYAKQDRIAQMLSKRS